MATRLRAEVNWMLNWANCPEVEVYWDKFPDYEALRYEERNGMYRAESADGDVSFYYWRGSIMKMDLVVAPLTLRW